MPVTLTYPGVYVQELLSPVRPIVGVQTAVAAFVGSARRGPVNEAVQLNSFSDYERTFGNLDTTVPLSYAVYLFFLNGGATALVIRNKHADDTTATLELNDTDGNLAVTIKANSPGAWGREVLVTVDQDKVLESDRDKRFNLTLAYGDKAERYTGLNLTDGDSHYLPRALAESQLVTIELATPKSPATLKIPENTVVEATSEATAAAAAEAAKTPADADKAVKATPKAEADAEPDAGPRDETTAAAKAAAKAAADEKAKAQKEATAEVVARLNAAAEPKIAPVALKGGEDALIAEPPKDEADKIADPKPWKLTLGDADKASGIYALTKADIFNILCLPLDPDVSVDPGELDEAIAFCEQHRAMLIVDPPAPWSKTMPSFEELTSTKKALNSPSENAAVYYPNLVVRDPAGTAVRVGPAGAIAGVWAATDTARGVWKAPAGTAASIAGISELDVHLGDAESGILNPIAINALRTLPLVGPVSWGARTSVGADQAPNQWKYIPVRRTALYIEESLRRGTQWVVFEPNDEPLWSSIRLNVGAFMQGMFRQGAFQGSTPAEAYLVKCDKDNNPQSQIDLGIVSILVGFAPLKPAEFVIINIQQQAGQSGQA